MLQVLRFLNDKTIVPQRAETRAAFGELLFSVVGSAT